MEAKDNQDGATESQQTACWVKSGCALGQIANDGQWRQVAKNIDRQMIINVSEETRAMLMAAALLYREDFKEVCRMVFVANDDSRVDHFEYYAKVLRMMHPQMTDKGARFKIVEALSILPYKELQKLYDWEFEEVENSSKKKNTHMLVVKESDEFIFDCELAMSGCETNPEQKELQMA